PLGYAYILAILMSLLVALTVTPALCYILLKNSRTDETPPLIRWLQPRYAALLKSTARRPKAAMWISAVICGLALLSLTNLGGEFLPRLREGHFIVHTTALPG